MRRAINKAGQARVAETVARLIAQVGARGSRPFATIDHRGEAPSAGLELTDAVIGR
ncbi:MAG: hypothetical protein ACJ76X_07415 [Solirubrobacteraceae bacterium]|jgi:hypothetical protein